jgi:hypothetical protein
MLGTFSRTEAYLVPVEAEDEDAGERGHRLQLHPKLQQSSTDGQLVDVPTSAEVL